ncbi:hypothetical protein ABMY26_09325 [Azospirillum sp. HJ39]
MAINPWTAIGYAIRSAHIVGDTKGAAVRLDNSIAEDETRGVKTLYCGRAQSNDGSHNVYTITAEPGAHGEQVYWLPWGQNPMAAISALNNSGATFFLTSEFSGCYFVGCNGVVMHTAAGYKQNQGHPLAHALAEMQEWGEELDQDTSQRFVLAPFSEGTRPGVTDVYGTAGTAHRSVVMGWKQPGTPPQWCFAYQDLTMTTSRFGIWRRLRPQ